MEINGLFRINHGVKAEKLSANGQKQTQISAFQAFSPENLAVSQTSDKKVTPPQIKNHPVDNQATPHPGS